MKKFKLPKIRISKYLLIPLVSLVIILLASAIFAYLFIQTLTPTISSVTNTVTEIKDSFQSQNLIAVKEGTNKLSSEINTLNQKYQKINWLKVVPIIGNYAKDGQRAINSASVAADSFQMLITSVEPYSDLLGFKTDGAADSVKINSIEDRIVFMAETLDKISPELESIANKLKSADEELRQINPKRYPESLFGKQIRSKIVTLQDTFSSSVDVLSQAQPLIKLLPDLLGNPDSKTYMILFQNDAEIRPTGGFMTAYAYLKVSKGKIEPLGSYDIYDLDGRWKGGVAAPDPIKKYLDENSWYIRNMNLSPDFRVSMDTFVKHYNEIPGITRVDGIIAIDTTFPVEIMKIIGPIGVGGWGEFSAENDPRCDCPQVVYALEEIADRPVGTVKVGRKAVLGPLMHSLLANSMGSPKHLWPQLINVAINSIKEKHLMFYFNDPNTQTLAENFNAAGRIKEFSGDYLHINDSNFGGAKSDMFIDREVEQEIEGSNGQYTKTVTISYNNPHKGSNCNLEAGQLCLNGTYRDWVRIYIPRGSQLISVTGSETKELVSEDLDKTVVEAFFTMRPQSSSKLVFKYTLPQLNSDGVYKMLIQKQPGLPTIKHTIIFNGQQKIIDLTGDQEITLN